MLTSLLGSRIVMMKGAARTRFWCALIAGRGFSAAISGKFGSFRSPGFPEPRRPISLSLPEGRRKFVMRACGPHPLLERSHRGPGFPSASFTGIRGFSRSHRVSKRSFCILNPAF